ncbi:MAG: hypothetical protein RL385_498 [Pseudomonadota bacterium]|jgi:hypothetical protein
MLSPSTNEESTYDDRVQRTGSVGLGGQLATILALKELRKAIHGLHTSTSNLAAATDHSAIVARLCGVVGRLNDYKWTLARELERTHSGSKVSRGRMLFRQHITFSLGELAEQTERQADEWRSGCNPQPLLRKTCSLALALGVAIDHIAEDVARFAGRH